MTLHPLERPASTNWNFYIPEWCIVCIAYIIIIKHREKSNDQKHLTDIQKEHNLKIAQTILNPLWINCTQSFHMLIFLITQNNLSKMMEMIRLDTITVRITISFRLFFVIVEIENGIYIDDFPMDLNKLYHWNAKIFFKMCVVASKYESISQLMVQFEHFHWIHQNSRINISCLE